MLDDVADALRNVIHAIAERASAARVESVPTSEFRYLWWDGSVERGASLQDEVSSELSFRTLFDRISDYSAQREITELADRVSQYDKQHGWSPQFLVSQWKLIQQYFVDTSGQIRLDEDVIRTTVQRYESAIKNAPYPLLTTVLWRGLSAPEQFALSEGIRFRPVVPSDYKVIGRESLFVGIREDRLIPYSSDWLCEIRELVAGQGHGSPFDTIQRVISAVALAVPGRAEARLVGTEFENEFLRTGRLLNPAWIATSRLGSAIVLTGDDLERAREIYALLQKIDEHATLTYLRIPMRRFRSSAARPTDEDTLIDFVVALESLLAPDTQSIEVTFRFRLRGASVLRPQTFGSSEDRLDFMNSLYRARSRVVHGQSVQDLRELVARAEAALKEIFMWFATHPKAEINGQAIVDEIDRKMVAAIHAG